MTPDPLSDLATAAGLILDWEDIQGTERRVAPDAVRAILSALGLACASDAQCRESLAQLAEEPEPDTLVVDAGVAIPVRSAGLHGRLVLESGAVRDVRLEPRDGRPCAPPIKEIGYHRLELDRQVLTLAVCPPRCLTPLDRLRRRAWGLTAQIYSLAGPRAFGDFADLAEFATAAGAQGADALAISPVHALFAADPGRYSPYSPSSRDHLNGLLASVRSLGLSPPPEKPEALIDWRAASPLKLAQLRAALAETRSDPRRAAFVEGGGADLRRHALFEALHGFFLTRDGVGDWRDWPAAFRRPETAADAAADLDLEDEVEFHLGLQWLADLGLAQAQEAACAAGMGIGLVSDLAVGLDPAGSHAWSRPEDLLSGLTLGAPPDAFQADGQGWGITSFSPAALQRTGFAPFLKTLRAALRHAGGVRIDHALGLKRLWMLPEGASPLEGAYLTSPFEDLLRLIALESHRANAIVIGEDLGVVPPGLRDALCERGLLGMRVLPFEQEEGRPRAPAAWDPRAVAMTSTHDLPPVAGWWRGVDLDWRSRLGEGFERGPEDAARIMAREALWSAASAADLAEGAQPAPDTTKPVVDAALAYTAATACELLLVPVEDLLGLDEAVNLPGIVERHPNWRRRLPLPTADLFDDQDVRARIDRLNAERPR